MELLVLMAALLDTLIAAELVSLVILHVQHAVDLQVVVVYYVLQEIIY